MKGHFKCFGLELGLGYVADYPYSTKGTVALDGSLIKFYQFHANVYIRVQVNVHIHVNVHL
jgi:hypothetical protein